MNRGLLVWSVAVKVILIWDFWRQGFLFFKKWLVFCLIIFQKVFVYAESTLFVAGNPSQNYWGLNKIITNYVFVTFTRRTIYHLWKIFLNYILYRLRKYRGFEKKIKKLRIHGGHFLSSNFGAYLPNHKLRTTGFLCVVVEYCVDNLLS